MIKFTWNFVYFGLFISLVGCTVCPFSERLEGDYLKHCESEICCDSLTDASTSDVLVPFWVLNAQHHLYFQTIAPVPSKL